MKKVFLIILTIISLNCYSKTFKIEFGKKFDFKKTIKEIKTGMGRTAIIYTNGTASMWGRDQYNQSDIPNALQGQIKDIFMSWSSTIILNKNDKISAFGNTSYNQTIIPSSLSGKNIVDVSGGNANYLVLASDGTTYAWGQNNLGQSNIPINAQTGVSQVSCGLAHCLALKNGNIIAWGDNAMGEINVPSALSNVKKIEAGGPNSENSLALTSSGNLYVWGDNTYGQDDVPSGIQGSVKNAYLGDKYVVAITSSDNVIVFGNTSDAGAYWLSQLNNSYSGVKSISIGPHHNAVLLNNSMPLIWGNDYYGQATIPSNVKILYQ